MIFSPNSAKKLTKIGKRPKVKVVQTLLKITLNGCQNSYQVIFYPISAKELTKIAKWTENEVGSNIVQNYSKWAKFCSLQDFLFLKHQKKNV